MRERSTRLLINNSVYNRSTFKMSGLTNDIANQVVCMRMSFEHTVLIYEVGVTFVFGRKN